MKQYYEDELTCEQSRDPDYEPQEVILSSPVLIQVLNLRKV